MLNKSFLQKSYGSIFLLYLAVLPMSNTIALRNLSLLLLIAFGVVFILKLKLSQTDNKKTVFSSVPKIFLIWAFFLFFFPLYAKNQLVAFENLGGQWVESIFAFVVGFCAVQFLSRSFTSLWALALASMFPLVLHLLMAFLAWGGVLEHSLPVDVTISSFWGYGWARFVQLGWHWQGFPWGFRGLEPMHGNLGYTACQALGLLTAIFYKSFSQRKWLQLVLSAFCIVLSFACISIADSRGAILFGLLLFCFMSTIFFFKTSHFSLGGLQVSMSSKFLIVGLLVGLGLLISSFAYFSVRTDARWALMLDKVEIGINAPDPAGFLCNGISDAYKQDIRKKYEKNGEEYIDNLIKGLEGQDGGRILLMRTAFKMVVDHPLGIDGSRDVFKDLMAEQCGHKPTLDFAHSHEGWLDMALALGWIGAALYASLLGYCVLKGWAFMKERRIWPYAFALLGIGVFWLMRGFADSMYREHYLQMQALVLSVLYFRIRQSD